jgi:hypothetical protein
MLVKQKMKKSDNVQIYFNKEFSGCSLMCDRQAEDVGGVEATKRAVRGIGQHICKYFL